MQARNLASWAYIVTAFCFLMAIPMTAKQKDDWKSFGLGVENVHACAFTPDGRAVAFLHWNSHMISEKPWKVVYTSHLAVWHFNSGKVEEKLNWDYTSNNQSDAWPLDRRYLDYSLDGLHLVLLGSEAIHVFDTTSYRETQRIAVGPPKEKFTDDGWAAVDFSLAADGSRAAVAISSTVGANGGFVRVYDLGTGQVVREWRLHDGTRYVSGVALSPDGKRVAVSSLPIGRSSNPEAFVPAGVDNVRVLDVKSGEMLTGVNTKYLAGPVLFGPNDTLLTGSINDDRSGYALDTIKVWDARTGKLLREIAEPRTGVHYRLDLSPDGKVLLGYTGAEKSVENFVTVDTQQFQIWDFASGRALAASPEFGPNKDEIPRIQLSADGKFVVVWWGNGFAKPFVYAVPQH